MEVSHAPTIYGRVLHVKHKMSEMLIFMQFKAIKLSAKVGLTREMYKTILKSVGYRKLLRLGLKLQTDTSKRDIILRNLFIIIFC